MDRDHFPLRLVVDNSRANFGVISTPASSSSSRTAPRQCHGTVPRRPHIDTECGLRPSLRLTALGPPRDETDLSSLRITSRRITYCDVLQAIKSDAAVPCQISHHVSMTRRSEAEIADQMVANIQWLFDESGETKKAFAERMGMTYGAFYLAMQRKSFKSEHIVALAQSLDISMDFISGLITEVQPLRPVQPSRPTFWDFNKDRA